MPVVFVHGVNNRIEDPDYAEGVACKSKFLKSLLLPKLGQDSAKVLMSFPYWGGEGVKFRWNQASVPVGSKDVEALALGTSGADSANAEIWLEEARFHHGAHGVNLGQLSKTKGFATAIDLVWDTASVLLKSDQDYDDLLEGYAASMAYATAHPVPAWAFQEPFLSNDEFIDRLMAEIGPYRAAKMTGKPAESLGLSNRFRALRETISRLAKAPNDAASALAIGLMRKSAHAKASRFLGDVFIYLDKRGTVDAPGEIITDVLEKLRAAEAAKQIGDDKLIVIGHSLGGVIMYDVLTHFAPDVKVEVFVTVGSQVALFEEMALYRISAKEFPADPKRDRLESPVNIARWLNIYDTNDVFSFRAETVFNGVDDYRFDTGYGLLDAHGGYFARPSFYKRLAIRLTQED
ncbi:lipase family protein [Paraburkholderia caledonica]|uniref:hypothetical protein n=1 Tax=Paraburkholderia caledonica TaxID=134536 RepID=UPI0003777989|nr:hypothetical protein [Paraburkholderia caledonica]